MIALVKSARPLAVADYCCVRRIARGWREERRLLASGEASIGSQRPPGDAWTLPRMAERIERLSTTLLRRASRGPERKLRSRNRAVVVVLKTLQPCRVDANHPVVEQT
jgi:hypothetical protein